MSYKLFMVKIRTSFNGLKAGEMFVVGAEFVARYGQYIEVLGDHGEFHEPDEPVEEVLEAFEAGEKGVTRKPRKKASDGASGDLQAEGELPGA